MRSPLLPSIAILSIALAACGQTPMVASPDETHKFAEQFLPDVPTLNAEGLSVQTNVTDKKVFKTHKFSNGKTYEYTVYNNLVINGDMVLGTIEELQREIEEYELSLNSLEPQGAMASKCESQFLGFLWCNGFYGRKWDYNIVYLEPYSASLTDADKSAINSAIQHIELKTNIRFSFTYSGDRVYFTNDPYGGCWSRLGREGGRQQLNLGNGCKTMGIAVHELLHASGMIHELQRPDRDQYISVNTSNLTDKGKANIAAIHSSTDITEMSSFDYGSIMMYPQYTRDTTFVYDINKPMFNLKQSYNGTVGQRNGLSTLDIQTINTRYR